MSIASAIFITASKSLPSNTLQEIEQNKIKYIINTHSITALWTVLDDGGYYINNYLTAAMIQIVGGIGTAPPEPTVMYVGPTPTTNHDIISYEHNVTFSNLIIGEYYKVVIKPKSVTGATATGTYSNPMRTQLSVTDRPPNVPVFRVLGPTFGELRWEVPSFRGGSIIQGYQIQKQVWYGNQQYIPEVQTIQVNGTSRSIIDNKYDQEYKIIHSSFNGNNQATTTSCFDPFYTNETTLKTLLSTLGTIVGGSNGNHLTVKTNEKMIKNATSGVFSIKWSITFHQDVGDRPTLLLSTTGCTAATTLTNDERNGIDYDIDVRIDTTTNGIASRNYETCNNLTNGIAFNISTLEKGSTHLFRVAAWNEAGLSSYSLPSEPKTSEMIVKLKLNGISVSDFGDDAQVNYLNILANIIDTDVINLKITNILDVTDGTSSRRLRTLEQEDNNNPNPDIINTLQYKIETEPTDSIYSIVKQRIQQRHLSHGGTHAIQVTTVLFNISASQGVEAETSINNAIASEDPTTSFVAQLNNASIATTTVVVNSEVIVEEGIPDQQPATIPDTILNAPNISNVAGSRVTLNWDAPLSGGNDITGYAIWFNATHKQVENTRSTDTTYVVTSLLGETKYNFSVSAINSVGLSIASPTVSVTTLIQPPLPVFRGCDSTCTSVTLSSTDCNNFHSSTGSILNTIYLVTDDCKILLSNKGTVSTPINGITDGTAFYFKVYTDRNTWDNEPIEPSQIPIFDTYSNENGGWLLYDINNPGIELSQIGQNLIRAISVRGGEFQAHSSLIVSIDVPYKQITSINYQNPAVGDTDTDVNQIAGNLELKQGDSVSSSTTYTAYWGKTKTEYLLNSTGQKISIFTINANENSDAINSRLSQDTTLPTDATHILITSSNEIGENTTSPTYLRIYDSTGTPGKFFSSLLPSLLPSRPFYG
jgi:hypothetical protein